MGKIKDLKDFENVADNIIERAIEGWPEDQPGWDGVKGILTIPRCEQKLCCQINPFRQCMSCWTMLCSTCMEAKMNVAPPWDPDNMCGEFRL